MCYNYGFRQFVLCSVFLMVTFICTPFSFADAPMPAVKNKLYSQECGACHWPFLPGLLPETSWNRLLKGLDTHFGEDASLDAESTESLRQYLTENAADKITAKRSRKIMRSLSSSASPLRVTEIPYIIRKHRELGLEIFKRPGVKSFSNCASCHPKAMAGDFEDDDVRIPGNLHLSKGRSHVQPAISLAEAIALAQERYPGRFVEAEMERGVYEVEIRTNQGSIRKVFVDPANGKVLENSYIDDDGDDDD